MNTSPISIPMRPLAGIAFTGPGVLNSSTPNVSGYIRVGTGTYNWSVKTAHPTVDPGDIYAMVSFENDDSLPFGGMEWSTQPDGTITFGLIVRKGATTGNGDLVDAADIRVVMFQMSKNAVIDSGNP